MGSGGREHAIVWKLARSKQVSEIIAAPGNPGMDAIAECVPIPTNDQAGIVRLAQERAVDLVVVGPEDPLAAGLADRIEAAGIRVFGHSAAAARIESSKAWSKSLMERAAIPTARSRAVVTLEDGIEAVRDIGGSGPVVIKADGLAAGKGVIVADNDAEAIAALESFLGGHALGHAGTTVLVEECLTGPEVSILLFADGPTIRLLPPSCDHKRAHDDDLGPNTGGMGVYTPTTLVDADLMTRIEREIVRPAVETMAKEGNPLRGVLYPGLMLTPAGPKLIEFNCRFGDPEAQVVLPTTRGDLGEWCLAVADGSLDTTPDPVQEGAAVGVALASGGYPGSYETGKPIHGLESVASDPNVIVFHAGTKRLDSGEIVTAGGRVLTVVGLGPDLATARTRAYAAAGEITFDGRHMRSDIAVRELPVN
ncbi:MAG TPA: phosphoribosylamine--glycine ligase [Thermomicrobiales bacterium]|nr:phosphoribosylamine--glycine ligase [Thermomicrobiales bacterium]